MIRFCLLFCAIWSTSFAFDEPDEFKIICYVSSPSNLRDGNGKFDVSDIDPKLCTHLVYSLVDANEDGTTRFSGDGTIPLKSFNSVRERSPGTKILVQIGVAWGSKKSSTEAASFAENLVAFVTENGFDGMDLHWETPGLEESSDRFAEDLENHILLLKELRSLVDRHGLILFGSLMAVEDFAMLSYDVPQISEHLDFLALMTYWFYGPIESTFTYHNSPLYTSEKRVAGVDQNYSVDSSVRYWLSQGVPKHKIILGTATFGKSFTLADSSKNFPGSSIGGAGERGPYTKRTGFLGYNEICEFEGEKYWAVVWDREQRVPYAFSNDQWVSYENVRSMTEKANYVKDAGLGGVLMYSLDMDDFRGNCGERYPLLNALNSVLRADNFGFCSAK